MKQKLSIIVPCFHSERSLPVLMEAIVAENSWLNGYDYEVILVNDGSGLATWEAITALTEKYPFCRGIDLSRNCGQHNAILAGMACAIGDYIVGLDDDLQTHPSQIPLLLDKLQDGYDIVYGKFRKRHHCVSRNLFSRVSELSARYLLDKPAELKACPMYAIRSFVRDEIIRSSSAYTNLLGLFLRTSGRITNVEIQHFDRAIGKSGYTLRKLLRLWSSYLNYSMKPLRLLLILGDAACVFAIAWMLLLAVTGGFSLNTALPAWMLLLSGVLLMGMGLVGEYLGRMFMIISKEPQYVVREDTEKQTREHFDSRCG